MGKLPILVIATRNPEKQQRSEACWRGFRIKDIKNLSDFGPIPEVEEDGDTFDANAYKKASFTARVLGVPAIADDSGISVDALNGAPGVHSARYGGQGASDEDRRRKLLAEMEGRTHRQAAFECVISLAVPSGPALTYEGRCEGVLAEALAGANGFGYDPIFYYPPLQKTFAELTREEKSRVSHRGKALRGPAGRIRQGAAMGPAAHAAGGPVELGKMTDTFAFHHLVRRTRSTRRFDEDRAVDRQTLVELIDLARLFASGGNKQPLRYILGCAASMNARIFPCLRWAAYARAGRGRGRASGPRLTLSSSETPRSGPTATGTSGSPPRASCWGLRRWDLGVYAGFHQPARAAAHSRAVARAGDPAGDRPGHAS